jgi:hypothetical protein
MHSELGDLIERLRADTALADWVAYRHELVELSPRLDTEADHVALLSVFKLLMDTVEPSVSAADLANFQKLRLHDYRRLLVEEAIDGGEVDPLRLDHITQREVAAGRLAADDDLRELGQIGGTFLAPPPTPPIKPPPKRSWLGRLFGSQG